MKDHGLTILPIDMIQTGTNTPDKSGHIYGTTEVEIYTS